VVKAEPQAVSLVAEQVNIHVVQKHVPGERAAISLLFREKVVLN
jgi:hypothetical protein